MLPDFQIDYVDFQEKFNPKSSKSKPKPKSTKPKKQIMDFRKRMFLHIVMVIFVKKDIFNK